MNKFSRKSHVRNTSDSNVVVSDTLANVFCHSKASVSNAAKNREANIFCTCTWFSSNVSTSFSNMDIFITLAVLWGSKTNSVSDHVRCSFAMVNSILASCLACSARSSTSLGKRCKSMFHKSRSNICSVTCTTLPHKSMIISQCLGRMDVSRSSATSGQNTVHRLMTSCMPMYTSDFLSILLNSFSRLKYDLIASSMTSASTAPKRTTKKASVSLIRSTSRFHNKRTCVTSSRMVCMSFWEPARSSG
mmetsp:Transcript_39940/g.120758  ORF Transcript_39940/g.120758 Transcript_39940/m.120758 type:complete len:247 (-) Transcript_39940:1667-2407(-)